MFVKGKETQKTENDIFSIGNFVLAAEIDNYNMFKLIKFCKDSKIAHKVEYMYITYAMHKNFNFKFSCMDFPSNIRKKLTKLKKK